MSQTHFDEVIQQLLNNPSTAVSIKGTKKKIKGFAEFKTVNLGEDGYYKIVFDDHSFLLLVPSIKAAFYADSIEGTVEGITNEMIGHVESLEYKGKKYRLENKDDFQYVIRLYVGGPNDIEGECRFSDYVPIDDPESEILSLGWLTRNGERADINPLRIPIEEIITSD